MSGRTKINENENHVTVSPEQHQDGKVRCIYGQNLLKPLSTLNLENGMDETLNEESIKKVAAGNLEEDPFADSNIILENNDGLEEADDNCGYCGEKFDNENELNLHIIEVHG